MHKKIAIILAAGKGRRLYPFTKTKPKCLLTIGSHPLLYYQLHTLKKYGVTNIILIVGYKRTMIQKYISRNFPSLKITFITNRQFAHTNTLYSLSLTLPSIQTNTQIILLNGDIIFAPKILYDLLKSSRKNLVVTQKKTCYEEEVKVFSKKNKVIYLRKDFVQKTYIGESVGIYLFSPRFWRKLSQQLTILQKTHPNEYFEFAVEKVLQKETMYPFITTLLAKEIDFPADLLAVRKEWRDSIF